jgi:hypothetical protein
VLVYGDRNSEVETRAALGRLAEAVRGLDAGASGLHRLAATTTCFIDIATLAQGLIDEEFARTGHDELTPRHVGATRLAAVAAGLMLDAWRSETLDTRPLLMAIESLGRLGLPEQIVCRQQEGYAFYALYPEAYIEAAAALGGRRTTAVGIRSIGLGLAALIAMANGSAAPITLRPVGPPFARQLAVARPLRMRLARQPPDALYAVADEGPGLSGSSFGAVIDLLLSAGIDERRIHLFPSHAGLPGAAAGPAVRARWQRLARHIVDFDALYLDAAHRPARHLAGWFADLVGPAIEPLRELSGGNWRTLLPSGADWPPAHVQQERRKFLLVTAQGRFLLKFTGLGRSGDEAFGRGRRLSAAGFTPEVIGFRHGFTLQRWETARPADFAGPDRRHRLDRIGGYLAFRARTFPAAEGTGATLAELAIMLRQNGREALGANAGPGLDRLADGLANLHLQRVATDNRLQPWEWLDAADGRLLKTDAVDHCAGHDLIGCQDIAWDIAGARVEFSLSPEETQRVTRVATTESGVAIDPKLIAFLLPCYLAFQLGAYSMAADTLPDWPDEQARLRRRVAFYRDSLARLLAEL